MAFTDKYGVKWNDGSPDALQIEFHQMRLLYDSKSDKLVEHYLNAHKLLWPEDIQHRWFVLGITGIVKNQISVMMGCASSGKTYIMSAHALIDFFCFPRTSLALISSTEKRSLEIKVFGRVKELFNRARARYSWIEGFILDSSMTITPDEIDDDNEFARSLNRGLVCVPCVSGGRFIGMSKFQGCKAPNSPGKADGIIKHYGDECFPAGTLVDTPIGRIAIEKIKVGDFVFSAAGVDRVRATMSRISNSLVTVKTNDGRKVECTPNHPFFTKNGWKRACHLTAGDYIFSQHEALLILQKGIHAVRESKNLLGMPKNSACLRALQTSIPAQKTVRKGDSILQPVMQIEVGSDSPIQDEGVCSMLERISSDRKSNGLRNMPEGSHGGFLRNVWPELSEIQIKRQVYFLQSILRLEIAAPRPGLPEKILHEKEDSENYKNQISNFQEASGDLQIDKIENVSGIPDVEGWSFGQGKGIYQSKDSGKSFENWTRPESKGRQWVRPNENGENATQNVSGFGKQLCGKNRENSRTSNSLQNRRGDSVDKVGNRSRWSLSFSSPKKATGFEEGSISSGDWVDSITLQKLENIEGGEGREGGNRVYNLEIEKHPSYSVLGFLIHNCAVMQPSFLDGYSNWMVNPRFKGIMSGNPTDISDPLCIASEPKGGWDAFEDTGKTQEWKSKWYGAHVIAFDGRDSPSNDQPGVKYPFLVSNEFIKQLADTHGADSWQYFQQGVGKPSRGMVSNRVITIGLCEQHKAFESVTWIEPPSIKMASLDPAFGGGDRCVWREGSIGYDTQGKQILEVGSPEIIPIKLNSRMEPEEQIAVFVKEKSDRLGINPKNIFYDSFGRGTLGNDFAKVFGYICPIPVDSGAKTTERPVRFDLFVTEKGQRRLLKCSEHYSKFVTEMWFSTREAIQAEQVRGLDSATAHEGQLRMFRIVIGNKVEVESKDDMKERIKKSPDFYDNFAIMVEGARQLGFKILRLGSEVKSKEKDFLLESQQETDSILSEAMLNHSQ